MVVGTHVEIHMVVTVPPLDEFLGGIHHLAWSIRVTVGAIGLDAMDLGKKPATGNHGMGLEQFKGCISTHLTRDDAQQVVLNTEHVNRCQFSVLNNEAQSTLESLVLLTLPVETHADGHILERERGCIGVGRLEHQLVVAVAVPLHHTLDASR